MFGRRADEPIARSREQVRHANTVVGGTLAVHLIVAGFGQKPSIVELEPVDVREAVLDEREVRVEREEPNRLRAVGGARAFACSLGATLGPTSVTTNSMSPARSLA